MMENWQTVLIFGQRNSKEKIKRLESYQQQAMLVPKAIMHCEMIWKYALDYDKGKQTKQKQRKKSKKKKKRVNLDECFDSSKYTYRSK